MSESLIRCMRSAHPGRGAGIGNPETGHPEMSTEPTTDQATEPKPDLRAFVAIVAKNIRVQAAAADITISELANRIDLGQPALSRRMSGVVDWSLSDLLDIARYFRIPLSEICPDSLTVPDEEVTR